MACHSNELYSQILAVIPIVENATMLTKGPICSYAIGLNCIFYDNFAVNTTIRVYNHGGVQV